MAFTPGLGSSSTRSGALSIPGKLSQDSSRPTYDHTVKKGETLSKIARESGVSMNQLLEANPQFKSKAHPEGTRNPDEIKTGESVRLPAPKATLVDTEQPAAAAKDRPSAAVQGGARQGAAAAEQTVKERVEGAAQRDKEKMEFLKTHGTNQTAADLDARVSASVRQTGAQGPGAAAAPPQPAAPQSAPAPAAAASPAPAPAQPAAPQSAPAPAPAAAASPPPAAPEPVPAPPAAPASAAPSESKVDKRPVQAPPVSGSTSGTEPSPVKKQMDEALGRINKGLPPGYSASATPAGNVGKGSQRFNVTVQGPNGTAGKSFTWEAIRGGNEKRLEENVTTLTKKLQSPTSGAAGVQAAATAGPKAPYDVAFEKATAYAHSKGYDLSCTVAATAKSLSVSASSVMQLKIGAKEGGATNEKAGEPFALHGANHMVSRSADELYAEMKTRIDQYAVQHAE
jgi:hypothetical protein